MATAIVLALIGFAAIVVLASIGLSIVREDQTKQIDHDKIANGLGAERGGEIPAKSGYFGAMETAANKPMPPTIIPATEDFQIKLEDALAVAGLPTDTRSIIGQMFSFEASIPRSAEHRTIIGNITGLETSNLDKGVNLFLSARQFNGVKIKCLHIEYNEHLNERQYSLILKDNLAIPGQFRLLND